MDIFGVITKLKISGHFYSFYGLFYVKVQNGVVFVFFLGGGGGGVGLLKFQVFWGELEIPDIF